MTKYTPLQTYLSGLPSGTKDVTLSFEHIERIISDRLPKSAQQYRPWGSNEKEGSHIQARSWMNAGWLVDSVNFKEKWARFRRSG